jgi:hypothetical protein
MSELIVIEIAPEQAPALYTQNGLKVFWKDPQFSE